MGQKVNPNGFRYGINKDRNSNWYAKKPEFVSYLIEDQKIREFLLKSRREYGIGNITVDRDAENNINVKVFTSKPGVLLGQGGENIGKVNLGIKKWVKNKNLKLTLESVTIEKPEISATLVAEEIAEKLENRGSFRAAQKFVIRSALKAGALGIKTEVSGRLNGVDMARTEGYSEGEMKLHTLRRDVDFAKARAHTKYGIIGIKVWISKGDILKGGE